MFERFSDAARLAMFAARLEVTEAASDAIAPAHLLLGLLEAHGGVATRLAGEVGVRADEIRPRLLTRATTPLPLHADVPFAATAKAAIDVAGAEADAMACTEITTGHLLLGLMRDESSPVALLLHGAGLGVNAVRSAVEAQAAAGSEARAPGLDEVFEARLRRVELL